MTTTVLSGGGFPRTASASIADKTVAASTSTALTVGYFDIWQESYAGATVEILIAGTTTPAEVFSDFNLSRPVANPQLLLTREDSSGRTYGRFATPLYVNTAYSLAINTQEQTGVVRTPLSTLNAEEAGFAVVRTTGGSIDRELRDRFGDFINVADYGSLKPVSAVDASTAENTATIQAAIGIASGAGGGTVHLPAGRYAVTTLQVPTNVILRGQGRSATILQSEEATTFVAMTGDDGGLANLTLDGVDLTGGGFGIAGRNVDRIRLDGVTVKRFDIGIRWKGGCDHRYEDLVVRNCNHNFQGLGDADASNGSSGDDFDRLIWRGGEVSQSTTTGLELSVVDLRARYNRLEGILFRDNLGDALLLYGAENTTIVSPQFTANTTDLRLQDNPDTTLVSREVRNVTVHGGQFTGALNFDGLCEAVLFDRSQFDGATFTFNTPSNQIVFRDTIETGTLTEGEGTKKSLFATGDHGDIVGTTSGATPVVVWKRQLEPGEVAMVNVAAVALRTDGEEYHVINRTHAARCDSAELDYDGQAAGFTIGTALTGQTSGARAVIVADADRGTGGTLSLINISGSFIDNELINDSSTGSGRVNGSITYNAAALLGAHSEHHNQQSGSTGYDIGFAVSNREMLVTVRGAADEKVSWKIRIDTTSLQG